jgi:HD superfamily phosphodiesterase
MQIKPFVSAINAAFHYVIQTSQTNNIDESHALRHSMDVYHFANNIYDSEIYVNSFLKEQKNIIMCSAILHDMCDKKYVDEKVGIKNMNLFMQHYVPAEEINVMNSIISTMSYSTVKKNGYPDLQNYNWAYHIVREADLLAGYDYERCIIYQMMHNNDDYLTSIKKANDVFHKRTLLYIKDDLFVTDYSKQISKTLHENALFKMNDIDSIL